jgi:hypothetical protein
MNSVKVEFDTKEAWVDCMWRLIQSNIDFASGNTEDMFIVVYDYHAAIEKFIF